MKSPKLEDLEREHKELYEQFLPTLEQYQSLAKRALELQIEIFKRRLCLAVCPEIKERHLVTQVSARLTPAQLERVIAELEKNEVRISEIVYDTRTFEFYLFTHAR